MVAFLAALPAIFAAIESATDLFDLGKDVVTEITGDDAGVQTPTDLRERVAQLAPEDQARFVTRMKSELAFYQAVTGRLTGQGGKVDAVTLKAIPERVRGRIAYLRMTTRPWAVRWMVLAVVFPPLALVCLNIALSVYNVWITAFEAAKQPVALIDMGTVLNSLYAQMVGWASAVIMTYMGMREIGKATGQNDGVKVSDVVGSLSGLVGNMKRVFK